MSTAPEQTLDERRQIEDSKDLANLSLRKAASLQLAASVLSLLAHPDNQKLRDTLIGLNLGGTVESDQLIKAAEHVTYYADLEMGIGDSALKNADSIEQNGLPT